jgi:hypothetical protein
MNPSTNALNRLFNPLTFFRHVSTNYVDNWAPHIVVVIIGSILAFVFGLLGVDYKRTCKDTDETFETRIKSQFSTWLVIISLVLCVSYIIIYIYRAIINQQ